MKSALVLLITACTTSTSDPSIDDYAGGKADGYAVPRAMSCHSADGTSVNVLFTPNGDGFDVTSDAFDAASQRPSLNITVDEGAEFVDFRPTGQTSLPAMGMPRFELTLATGDKTLTYDSTQLTCRVSATKLLAYLGIAPTDDLEVDAATSVGFDIDDTLLFSTPSFTRGFATGGTPAPTDTVFWTAVNSCDPGCPAETITLADGSTKDLAASDPSPVKQRVAELVAYHQGLGAQVYAITARPDIAGDTLRGYIEAQLGIPAANVFFQPTGKTDRMAQLGLQVFYGDSDSDITDSQKGNIRGIRVLRSPKSSYRSGGRLAVYHPGYFAETIVADSYE